MFSKLSSPFPLINIPQEWGRTLCLSWESTSTFSWKSNIVIQKIFIFHITSFEMHLFTTLKELFVQILKKQSQNSKRMKGCVKRKHGREGCLVGFAPLGHHCLSLRRLRKSGNPIRTKCRVSISQRQFKQQFSYGTAYLLSCFCFPKLKYWWKRETDVHFHIHHSVR